MTVSAIITAAGKNSRMRKDQISRNISVKNKLVLPFQNKTVLETTIDNAIDFVADLYDLSIDEVKRAMDGGEY